MIYFHGSPFKFEELRAGSYVCTSKDSALIWGIPWSTLGVMGDPILSQCLRFRRFSEIPETPLFLYSIKSEVIPALTNMGKQYPDVYQTIQPAKVTLEGYWMSWKLRFKQNSQLEFVLCN